MSLPIAELSSALIGLAVEDRSPAEMGVGHILDVYTHYHDTPAGTTLAVVQWGEGDEAEVSDRSVEEVAFPEAAVN